MAILAQGTPPARIVTVFLREHDVIAWFERNELGDLRLAHDSYLEMLTKALAKRHI